MSDPQGVSCPCKLPTMPFSVGVNKTLKANTAFLHSLLLPLQDPLPLTPQSSPMFLSALYLLIYDLISTQHTHPGVWKTLCSHSVESLYSIKRTHFTLLSLCSVFGLYSTLWGRRTWASPLTNLHKSSAHFTSRWFGSHSVRLLPHTLGIFTLAAWKEILSWCLSHSRSSPINYAVVNPITAELCQTGTLLIRATWKGGLCFCFSSIITTFLEFWIKVNLLYC